MKLLTEYHDLSYSKDAIKEAIVNKTPVTLRGIMQRAGVVNQNKRIYSKEILMREVENYMKVIHENRALGELDHPSESVVELKNVSHVVKDLWWEGDDLHGVVEVLNTPNGMILQSLLESEIKIGISSRGVGSLKKDGENNIVEDDYVLICFDVVSEPSTQGAFIVREAKDISLDILKTLKKEDRLNRILNNIITQQRL